MTATNDYYYSWTHLLIINLDLPIGCFVCKKNLKNNDILK